MHHLNHQPLPSCFPTWTCSSTPVLCLQVPTLHFLLRLSDYLVWPPPSQTRNAAVATDGSPLTSRKGTGCWGHQSPNTWKMLHLHCPCKTGYDFALKSPSSSLASPRSLRLCAVWAWRRQSSQSYISHFLRFPPELAFGRSSKGILRAAWMNEWLWDSAIVCVA